MEPQLLDALSYLFETPAPVVMCGPVGAGKTFTASVGHLIEGRPPAPCILYDAATFMTEEHAANLLGEHGEGGESGEEPVVFDAVMGGSLVVQRAQWVPAELFVALAQRAEQEHVRLYLCFDTPAGAPSPIEAMGEFAREVLGEREVVLPPIAARPKVLHAVIEHVVEDASWLAQREPLTISPAAARALRGYDWPGNVDELQATLYGAARRSRGDFLDLGDLPLEVRRGTF